MPDNLYETLITGGAPEEGSERASGLAKKLRGRSAIATLAQLSGDAVLSPFGAKEAKAVREQANQVRSSALQRAKAAQQKKQFEATFQQKQDLADQKIAADASNAAMQGGASKVLSVPMIKELNARAFEFKTLTDLGKRMDELQVGSDNMIPGVATVSNVLAGVGIGTQNRKKVQQWWADFRREWDIVERNVKFGATLSDSEKQSWKEASINEEMTQAQIAVKLDIMRQSADWKRSNYVGSLTSLGVYNDESILSAAAYSEYPPLPPEGEDETPADEATPGNPRSGAVYDASTKSWGAPGG